MPTPTCTTAPSIRTSATCAASCATPTCATCRSLLSTASATAWKRRRNYEEQGVSRFRGGQSGGSALPRHAGAPRAARAERGQYLRAAPLGGGDAGPGGGR